MTTKRVFFSILLAGLVAVAPAFAEMSGEIGRAFFENPQLEGTLEPAAHVVENDRVFKTISVGAIVHLANGQVLKFAENSSAKFSSDPDGDDVTVTVLSGQVSKWSSKSGETLFAGRGSVFVLGPSFDDPLDVEGRLLAAASGEAAGPGAESPRGRAKRPLSADRSRR